MTRAGVVFVFLNLLVGVFYVLLTAPVVQERLERRSQINAEIAKIPPLEAEIERLERLVGDLPYEITHEIGRTAHETTLGLNQRTALDGRIAVLNDAINDLRSKQKTLAQSLAEIRTEIDARKSEIAQLNERLAAGRELIQTRNNEIASLTTRLENTQKEYQKTMESIDEHLRRLIELEKDGAGAAEGKLASKR